MEKTIVYFESAGPQNTDAVLDAVRRRVEAGGLDYVIAASLSGRTALKTAKALEPFDVQVVCATGSATYRMYGYKWPTVCGEIRERLETLGVRIVESTPSTLSGDTVDYSLARYGHVPASWAVAETLDAVGGYGLKTAVEGVLMATDAGVVPPAAEVIAIAGTGSGADAALVAKSALSPCMFSRDPDRRFQVLEILAMPRNKTWHPRLKVGELAVGEIDAAGAD